MSLNSIIVEYHGKEAHSFDAQLKVRERKAKLNWDANQTARVKTRLPEEPEPEPGG
jgi:hypothetical protein